MNYKTKVYISGITNLSDARYAAGMMVDFLGFCIDDDHDTSISEMEFAAINGWIEGIELVGEFYNKPVEEINRLIGDYQLSYIQIPASRMADIDLINAKIILLANDSIPEIQGNMPLVRVPISAKDIEGNHILRDVTSQTVGDIDTTSVFGICIKGGQEERPGYKDYDEIGDVLEAIED